MPPHNQILSLARAGNPVRAWERFGSLGLADANDDVKALTLKGRLLKDLGDRAEGEEKLRLYREASQAYLAANAINTDTYPLINAATLALLSQDQSEAARLAQQVLDLIEADPGEGETPFWREATRAEALLLLGQNSAAQAALADGIAKLPRAFEDHAATIGQFERILAATSGDASWLDHFRPAPAVHFSGLIGLDSTNPDLAQGIAAETKTLAPGFAYGALAAGADIMIAEAMLEAGASLHIVLPFDREQFRAISVEPYGAQWCERFDRLLGEAEAVDELWHVEKHAHAQLASLVNAGDLVAMGQTLRRAGSLRTKAHALSITAQGEAHRSHLQIWDQAGLPLKIIETKRAGNGSPESAVRRGRKPIAACLSVRGATAAQLSAARIGAGMEMLEGTETIELCGAMQLCLEEVGRLHAIYPEAAVGIAACPFGDDHSNTATAALASRLALSAQPGQTFADYNTAMIAKVLSPKSRVEEMGEVSALTGPLTVCAIAI